MSSPHLKTVNVIGGSVHDADLITQIGIAFTTRPRISWNHINVAVRDAIVTLRGNVPTIYDRQLIVAVTRHVAGVRLVDDKLDVADAAATKPDSHGEDQASAIHRNNEESTLQSRPNKFSHLPVVSESLEQILSRTQSPSVSQ